jgi:hypothetical protein
LFISGGSVGDPEGDEDWIYLLGRQGTNITVSGGEILNMTSWGDVLMLGTEFFLDGLPLAGLAGPGDSVVLDNRSEGNVTGKLLDGSPVNYVFSTPSDFSIEREGPPGDLRLTLALPLNEGCDFEADGNCELADLELLVDAFGSNTAVFDLNGSGNVDEVDISLWLTGAGVKNLGRPYLTGDTNLDGYVNATDLNVVGINWQSPGMNWQDGDFNGDRSVNAGDLNLLGSNWQQPFAAAAPVAIPEPSGFILAIVAMVGLRSRRKMQTAFSVNPSRDGVYSVGRTGGFEPAVRRVGGVRTWDKPPIDYCP